MIQFTLNIVFHISTFGFRFWETLAYLANTLIFIIVGIVISEKAIFEIHGIDWFYMFALYFGCFVIRQVVWVFDFFKFLCAITTLRTRDLLGSTPCHITL